MPKGAGVQSAAAANGPAAVDAAAQPTSAAPVRDASGGYCAYDVALEVIRLTNEARAKASLGPLEIDEG